ncbi:MAG: hypothetical protein E7170_04485 [Firmicutes bacterium]|nr:hypothetical protein [Bacillota bacterium]
MKNILNELYIERFNLLMKKGREDKLIVDFDNYIYDRLRNVFVCSIPADINVKYYNFAYGINKMFERSFQMFMAFKEAKLVYADSKYFELEDSSSKHSWVEMGKHVYDPYFKEIFEKKLYYKIFKPKNIKSYTHKTFREEKQKLYDNIINTSILDFQPNGDKRHNLICEIPNALYYAEMTENKKLLKDLNSYLNVIKYDERKIYEEINEKSLHLNNGKS